MTVMLGDVIHGGMLRVPATLTFEEWSALGEQIGAMYRTSPWLVCDWLLAGEDLYGEKAAQAMEATGLALHTLQNLASLGRKVRPDVRRPELGISLHMLVSKLEPAEQGKWLFAASINGWTRAKMVSELQAAGVRPEARKNEGWSEAVRGRVRDVVDRELRRWREASDAVPENISKEREAMLRRELEALAIALVGVVEQAVNEKGKA